MSGPALRRWRWVHRWSSIVCTLFLLILCLTGLPLIFDEEIDRALAPSTRPAVAASAMPLDAMVTEARRLHGGERVRIVIPHPDTASVQISTAPGADDPYDRLHQTSFAADGTLLRDGAAPADAVMGVLLQLHASLLTGLPGEIFLALIGLIFLAALVSGVVLYAPFARRLGFGEIRRTGSRRLRWLDLHNVIGIVTLAWAGVVGATGVMNGLATPLFGIWQLRDVAPVLAPYAHDAAIIPTAPLSSAITAATSTVHDSEVSFVTFPTHLYGSPDHYVVWVKGRSKLRAQMLTPVLVDARDGHVAFVARMPWYLRALELSRPLHFGNYGGPILKILWAALDVFTIAVLCSGLYLLMSHPRSRRAAGPRDSEARRLVEGEA
ncbi:putative iron-regulated membrane protein [Endobacter medicaginis]|uniref:PepSY domain-containing protein n=1 Tax=Endobacter medicaginis TaxID=1181271 RepID=A0A839UVG7_9PROT|nr:PepSY-associated TM helix domain-containing protein [Endobacter medicaginis]MBB3173786.1 putative iron-regulated membrane protein [Endobacter medicaginis]MCX5475577.1 PepSY-associated TM helix domain-containing protein [Endobacter medicaginis]NVN29927.1 PepSY domain-containing protein [Endobacter medicaginis]